MTRVVFVNLHASWMLVKVSSVFLFKNSPAIKHGYLLQYLLSHPEKYEVCNYINDRGFSLYTKGRNSVQRLLNLFSGLENRIILRENGIDPHKITVLRKPSDIRHDDLVIMYNIHTEQYRTMDGIDAFKTLSMLHFHGHAEEDALMTQANINCFFNEVNLQKSSELFRRYYHLDRPWVVHPFVFAERFKNITPFDKRKRKAFAVGTITYKIHPEFISVYGNPCDQPMRKAIKVNPEYFNSTVDCYSEDYMEGNEGKKIQSSDNKLVQIYKKIYNRFNTGKQKKYFSFNMVEKFNEYKMCIVGEEILGVPGIGYVEGMACGCAYIGLDSPMYRDLGLIPGIHYIAYDGSKEDLRRVIEYYQADEHQEELERIAQTGCEYVRQHFNGPVVAAQLLSELRQQQQIWLSSNK